MIKTEKAKNKGGFDSFGNIGFVTTNSNKYVADHYENLPWKRMKDGVRGVLHFLNGDKVKFVPHYFA